MFSLFYHISSGITQSEPEPSVHWRLYTVLNERLPLTASSYPYRTRYQKDRFPNPSKFASKEKNEDVLAVLIFQA